ncbi:AAA family ATPase [bacterium]|nr:AAA family ATPase [bacterium]MBU1985208.1 AAA family ATPase [bacterium]
MISRIRVKYFKRFEEQEFDLKDSIVLAGPNNAGKSTLLQAVAVWNLAMSKWRQVHPEGTKKGEGREKQRPGIPITRKDFTAIPLREMNLLWYNRSTAYSKGESKTAKQGFPKLMQITLEGKDYQTNNDWDLTFNFRYSSTEQVYATPSSTGSDLVPGAATRIQVVHVPPFSGIGSDETGYDRDYQNLLIGQGKPGDILRNLLLDVYKNSPNDEWKQLTAVFRDLFDYTLLPPKYENRPYIVSEYLPGIPLKKGFGGLPTLDISVAGSGLHQVLLLLGFFFARPASVLLLDEPDAHLHVILQKTIYDRLRSLASQRQCQLLIATHSEVLIEGTDPTKIISFFGEPHVLLNEGDRDRIREALRRLTSLDILLAEQAQFVLYVEGQSDLDILKSLAKVLNHEAYPLLMSERLFWHSNQGRHPQEARGHLFALRAKVDGIKGLLLLDGDNRNLPDQEIAADGCLSIVRWKRYEIENYLLHPNALERFITGTQQDLFAQGRIAKAKQFLRDTFPPDAIQHPHGDNPYLVSVPASKEILPALFKAVEMAVTKSEYYKIAEQMKPEEIHPEVTDILNKIVAMHDAA